MVSLTSILATVTLVATSVDYVKAHGYMKEPLCSFVGKPTSRWITQIEPVWKGPWETCKNDKDLVAMFKKLALANNYKDLPTLMDGNPAFGKKCGFTNPNATPVAAPTNGKATFSRGMLHGGPCTIVVNNVIVYESENCQASSGGGNKATASVFQPVNYAPCPPSGCMFNFYWIGLQLRAGKVQMQSYKNCIPLLGPSGGGGTDDVSQEELSGNSNNSQNTTNTKSEDTPANKSEDSPTTAPAGDSPKTPESPSAHSPDTPATTPAPGTDDVSQEELSGNSNNSQNTTNTKSEDTPANKSEDSPTTAPAGDSPKTPESPSAHSPDTPATTPAPGTDDVSQEELSGNLNNSQNTTNTKSKDTPANKSEDSPTTAGDSPKTPESPSAYSPDTPATTPAPGSKCKGHRRRRY